MTEEIAHLGIHLLGILEDLHETGLTHCDVKPANIISVDGEWMLSALQNDGINVSNVLISDCVTGHAVIQVNSDGENAICLHGGANQTLRPSDIEHTIKRFSPGTILMLQNETNALETLLRMGAHQNLMICLNPSPISDSLLALDLRDVGLLVMNDIDRCHSRGADVLNLVHTGGKTLVHTA